MSTFKNHIIPVSAGSAATATTSKLNKSSTFSLLQLCNFVKSLKWISGFQGGVRISKLPEGHSKKLFAALTLKLNFFYKWNLVAFI